MKIEAYWFAFLKKCYRKCRSVIGDKVRVHALEFFKAHFAVVGIFLISFTAFALFAFYAQIGTGRDGVYQISIRDGNDSRTVITDALTVGDVLEQLAIEVRAPDRVRPALNALIDSNNFVIDIDRGRYIKVIDRGEEDIYVTTIDEPDLIVHSLGYQLYHGDQAVWRKKPAASANFDLQTPLSEIEILRDYDYQIKVDGERKSLQTPAGDSKLIKDILLANDYDLDNIAYVRPNLHEEAEIGQEILLYYEYPNKEIEYEFKFAEAGDDKLDKIEYIYQISKDPKTGLITNKETIFKKTINQIPKPKPVVIPQALDTTKLSSQQKTYLSLANIKEEDWHYVNFIISKESRWRHDVWNTAGSGAYGLCQSLPAQKMRSTGADYMTNPITQLKWCDAYAKKRYGSWQKAYNFWLRNSWW